MKRIVPIIVEDEETVKLEVLGLYKDGSKYTLGLPGVPVPNNYDLANGILEAIRSVEFEAEWTRGKARTEGASERTVEICTRTAAELDALADRLYMEFGLR